jgi:hypothetical protein
MIAVIAAIAAHHTNLKTSDTGEDQPTLDSIVTAKSANTRRKTQKSAPTAHKIPTIRLVFAIDAVDILLDAGGHDFHGAS